jgi:hypothetical protein
MSLAELFLKMAMKSAIVCEKKDCRFFETCCYGKPVQTIIKFADSLEKGGTK